jgi:hypothetical protein
MQLEGPSTAIAFKTDDRAGTTEPTHRETTHWGLEMEDPQGESPRL